MFFSSCSEISNFLQTKLNSLSISVWSKGGFDSLFKASSLCHLICEYQAREMCFTFIVSKFF